MGKEQYKSGFVAIVGRPNVGKSTLMNRLIGQKIAITSNKPQTTRNRIQTVYTCDRGQIIFLDTPGIHKAKNKLGEYMVNVAEKTLNDVDLVLWLVEPTNFIGAGEKHIAEQLSRAKCPVILTPHDGEFRRLSGIDPSADRLKAVKQLQRMTGATVLLKGHRTLICNGKECYVNLCGNPGMATGGSGDVLAGIIASLLGQGLSPLHAATAGAYLHGAAGDLYAQRFGEYGLLPSDLFKVLPRLLY